MPVTKINPKGSGFLMVSFDIRMNVFSDIKIGSTAIKEQRLEENRKNFVKKSYLGN